MGHHPAVTIHLLVNVGPAIPFNAPLTNLKMYVNAKVWNVKAWNLHWCAFTSNLSLRVMLVCQGRCVVAWKGWEICSLIHFHCERQSMLKQRKQEISLSGFYGFIHKYMNDGGNSKYLVNNSSHQYFVIKYKYLLRTYSILLVVAPCPI